MSLRTVAERGMICCHSMGDQMGQASITRRQEEAFEAAAATCVAALRTKTGVLHHDLWREAEGERRYVFNELYVDQAAVQAHMSSDHFKAFGLAVREVAAARPTIISATAVDVAG